MHINKLADKVNEYNNGYHREAKMKHIYIMSSTYINFGVESYERGPKFEVGDHVTKSKYKDIFGIGYSPHWSDEVFLIQKVKDTALWVLWEGFDNSLD